MILKQLNFEKPPEGLDPSSVDAPTQGASFDLERIDLALKLRKAEMTRVGHFLEKSPRTYFQTLTHQISLLASLDTFKQLVTVPTIT